VYERRTLHEEPHQPKRLSEEVPERKAKPLQPTTVAKVLLVIERTLLNSNVKAPMKTTPPDCIMPPRFLRAFDVPGNFKRQMYLRH